METTAGYQSSGMLRGAAAQTAQKAYPATRDNPMGEPQESVIFRSVSNLQDELNGLSVNIDTLCARIGAASRPTGTLASAEINKAPPEPTTSLLAKKIDDQAKRVRMLSNQIGIALEGLEL